MELKDVVNKITVAIINKMKIVGDGEPHNFDSAIKTVRDIHDEVENNLYQAKVSEAALQITFSLLGEVKKELEKKEIIYVTQAYREACEFTE